MQEMIEDVLNKSRQTKKPEEVDLNALLQREMDFLQADMVFKYQVVPLLELAADLPRVSCVYTDFSQVFGNLLRNAVDAMYDRPEKKLTVSTVFDDEEIVVAIEDTGCGINEEDIPHLFDPFFTTKFGDGNDEKPVGTGLGLYTVQQILEPYDASLEMESTVEVGTTFRVRIPRR